MPAVNDTERSGVNPADSGALELLDATRHLADRVWRSLAPPQVRAEVAAEIERLAERLAPFEETAPVRTTAGGTLPGRGHPLLPPHTHSLGNQPTLGTVTYTSAHAGAGEAVHGGYVTLLFDEVLGGVAGSVAPSRTASLLVNYRNLTPIGVELTIAGWVDHVEGRKIYVVGRLLDGARVCADAEALFVAVDDWS
jgi:acyl-coenzyme A thioesterase PaaI-like protein